MLFPKDYDKSLMTEVKRCLRALGIQDIARCQPTYDHLKYLEKPDMSVIPLAESRFHAVLRWDALIQCTQEARRGHTMRGCPAFEDCEASSQGADGSET